MAEDTKAEQKQGSKDSPAQGQETNVPIGNTGTKDSIPPTGIRGTFNDEGQGITIIQKNEK